MITVFHATTKPHSIAAIFYDGLDHQKVLDWIRKRSGIKGIYEASSNEILVQRPFEKIALRLRPGMILVQELLTYEVMTETLFRTMYNIESESHLN